MFGTVLAATVGSQLIGGFMANDAAKSAADTQAGAARDAAAANAAATDKAIGENRRQFDLTRSDMAPWMNTGRAALGEISRLTGLPGSSSAAGGGGSSGGGAQVDYNAAPADFVSQLYQNYLGREPDQPGLLAWMQHLREGMTKQDIEKYISSSEEAAVRAPEIRAARAQAQQAAPAAPAAPQAPTFASPETSPLLRKFTMEDMQNDPVYKAQFDFGMSEGEKAVQRMFGARGLSRSGAAVKAATRFATDYTGQQAGASRARFVEDQGNVFNKLAAVSGSGQAATSTAASAGAQAAGANAGLMAANGNTAAQLITGAGNARGAAAIAGGNALGGAANNIGNAIAGQYTLDRILTNGGITGQQAPLIQPMVSGQFNLGAYG